MSNKNYTLKMEEALETLKPLIACVSKKHSADILISAMIELSMKLSLIKYGPIGFISLLADILHSIPLAVDDIEELKETGRINPESDIAELLYPDKEKGTTH